MKKKTLLSSILVMALCLSIIAGSTFALFTDEKKLNIEVTSANVEVDAKIEIVDTWSAKADAAGDLEDENGNHYVHEQQPVGTFVNGGTAELVDGKIVINRITPGDKIDVKLTVENTGDVSMIYRYVIEADSSNLAEGMIVTTDKPYKGAQRYTSLWSGVKAVGEIATHDFSIELPVDATNKYQSEEKAQEDGRPAGLQKAVYTVTVEAVQGNANMDEATTQYDKIINVSNREELQLALQQVGHAYTINFLNDIEGDVTVPQKPDVEYTINGNGKTFNGAILVDGGSARLDNSSLTIKNVNFASADIAKDTAYINLGKSGDSNTRYTNHVNVVDCTFTNLSTTNDRVAAIKSYTGGDKNLTVKGCTVDATMHSLLQLANVEEGLTVTGCTVNSKNGINLNNSVTFTISDCKFDVRGYAIRVGVDGAINATEKEFFVSDCSIKTSASATSGDAGIIIRDSAAYCVLNLDNVTFDATNVVPEIIGQEPGKTTVTP